MRKRAGRPTKNTCGRGNGGTGDGRRQSPASSSSTSSSTSSSSSTPPSACAASLQPISQLSARPLAFGDVPTVGGMTAIARRGLPQRIGARIGHIKAGKDRECESRRVRCQCQPASTQASAPMREKTGGAGRRGPASLKPAANAGADASRDRPDAGLHRQLTRRCGKRRGFRPIIKVWYRWGLRFGAHRGLSAISSAKASTSPQTPPAFPQMRDLRERRRISARQGKGVLVSTQAYQTRKNGHIQRRKLHGSQTDAAHGQIAKAQGNLGWIGVGARRLGQADVGAMARQPAKESCPWPGPPERASSSQCRTCELQSRHRGVRHFVRIPKKAQRT